MAERPRYVLDASVALKWLLRLDDESHLAEADAVLTDYQEARIGLLTPNHLRYEVGHGLRRAVIRERLSWDAGRAALEWFSALRLPTMHHDTLLLQGWDLSRAHGCSFYDAVYLALAQATRYPLIHADNRLRNALDSRFPLELWIEGYRSPSS